MARVLVCTGPGQVDLIDRPDPPLGAGQVRIETLYSGISAGTEGTIVRGTNPYLAKRWDAGRRLFLDGSEPSLRYPVETWGYEEVGRVVEVADDVTDPPPGSLVYGTWGHRERHVASADEVRWRTVPDRLDPVAGIFSHMTAIALNGVLDADLAIGETAVVFGLGVPGQIVVQLAARSGARVVAVDPIAARRELARRLTPAATALDPRDASVAEAPTSRSKRPAPCPPCTKRSAPSPTLRASWRWGSTRASPSAYASATSTTTTGSSCARRRSPASTPRVRTAGTDGAWSRPACGSRPRACCR